MAADDLIQYLTQIIFAVLFLVALVQAVRRPARVTVDIALFFGAVAVIIVEEWAVAALGLPAGHYLTAFVGAVLMALPYLLLRLVNDFAGVPRWLLRVAEVGLALSALGFFAYRTLPVWFTLLLVLYFLALTLYAATAIVREARRSRGVTRRRMQAVAAGSVLLGLAIFLAGVAAVVPGLQSFLTGAVEPSFALASGLAYFLGFATPATLRRAWQEPEIYDFVERSTHLPWLPDTAAIVREIERGTALALGTPRATLGLWDPEAGVLRFQGADGEVLIPPGEMIAGRAFAEHRAVFSANTARDDPTHADTYRRTGARAVLAAPVAAGAKRLGVLSVDAPRAPIFAAEDLHLLQLLADQAAVVLESRSLLDEAARVQARAEATRLRDEFLSAAAHDLKTPLTTLVGQAQLLTVRAERDPAAPPNLAGLRRLAQEAERLRDLVLELLDASRLEHGLALNHREEMDLVALAQKIAARQVAPRHSIVVEGDDAVCGRYDRARIAQLLENLVGNALKYSPAGGEVRIAVRREGDQALLSVTDQGIGIPEADQAHIFERFQRGANVDDRRFAGMGLGLYICRGIVEQHGGTIRVSSAPGRGSTFLVTLPIATEDDECDGGEEHEPTSEPTPITGAQ
ncbi:MAG TPA: ATP-binding protein [Thermomicrobiales bacterium]|nr:ATP-binding protein [Thermomicrobiales bacterium]